MDPILSGSDPLNPIQNYLKFHFYEKFEQKVLEYFIEVKKREEKKYRKNKTEYFSKKNKK